MVIVPAGQLADLGARLLVGCGVSRAHAEQTATAADYADRRGLSTYGIAAVVDKYCPRLRAGRVRPDAVVRTVYDVGATAVLDGDQALGSVAMTAATDLVAHKALAHGVGAVAVRGSNHFGVAGFYTSRLADRGLISLVLTNGGHPGMVPPLGGAVRMLGTNPLSAAVPAGDLPPFVLDMSTTVVAASRLRSAGDTVPAGWLTGPDGRATTRTAAYQDGTADLAWLGGTATTGGAKGFGLGLLVELLCGPLAGAAFGPAREAPDREGGTGHLAVAFNPAAFGDPAVIVDRTRALLDVVRECPPASGTGSVHYPGAGAAARAHVAETAGVNLPDRLVGRLCALAEELSVPLPPVLRAHVSSGGVARQKLAST